MDEAHGPPASLHRVGICTSMITVRITAADVNRVKQSPALVATSSSSGSNGAVPNEVIPEEEELDFDKWQVHGVRNCSLSCAQASIEPTLF